VRTSEDYERMYAADLELFANTASLHEEDYVQNKNRNFKWDDEFAQVQRRRVKRVACVLSGVGSSGRVSYSARRARRGDRTGTARTPNGVCKGFVQASRFRRGALSHSAWRQEVGEAEELARC